MTDINSPAELAEARTAMSPMSLEELLGARCEECENCKKDDCGRCASCLANGASRSRVCIQRVSSNFIAPVTGNSSSQFCFYACFVLFVTQMCCRIPTERKAQPMPACSKFPKGWRFFIDPMLDGYRKGKAPMKEAEGLKILPPNGSFGYYSVERAVGKGCNRSGLRDVDANEFYKYIGVVSRSRPEAMAMQRQSTTGKGPTRESQVEYSVSADVHECTHCWNAVSSLLMIMFPLSSM